MLFLGHEHSGWCEHTLDHKEHVLEQYIERRAGELGLSETITPYVIQELKRRLEFKHNLRSIGSLEESKAFSSAKPRGKGSNTKRRDIRNLQGGSRFKSSQRQHARIAGKRLEKEVKDFAKHIEKQVQLYQQEYLSFTRLGTRCSIAFKSTVEEVFKLGMKAVGLVKPAGSSYDLTDNEKKWIKSYIREEMKYFNKFLRQIRDKPGRKDVKRRIGLYASSLKSVYEAGRLMSTGPEVLIYWTLESSNPCPDCILLSKYNPYTPDTLPCTPKSGSTRCLSHCYCKLRIDKATPYQVRKAREKHRKPSWLLKKIRDQRKKKT